MIADKITEILFRMRVDLRGIPRENREIYEAMNEHIATIGMLAAQMRRIEVEQAGESLEAVTHSVEAGGVVVPFRRRAG